MQQYQVQTFRLCSRLVRESDPATGARGQAAHSPGMHAVPQNDRFVLKGHIGHLSTTGRAQAQGSAPVPFLLGSEPRG